MSFSETAVKLHDEKKYNCCQAVFCSACGRCGIDEETGYRLGAFFGAGMRRGEVCGCVSGALMATKSGFPMRTQKRFGWGKETQWNERAFAGRQKRGI